MPRIKIKEGSYFYAGDAAGKQPPLLFCHGSGGSHRHWLYPVSYTHLDVYKRQRLDRVDQQRLVAAKQVE